MYEESTQAPLAARSLPEVMHRLRETVVSGLVDDLDRPHVLVCTESSTGVVSYQGPFVDALSASAAAERSMTGDEGLRCVVAPLLPPLRGAVEMLGR